MKTAYKTYFEENMKIMENALKTVDGEAFEKLIGECGNTLKAGHKIIVTGLGKNVPICEKFVGTMISLGMDAFFLNTNSAIHGDMGIIKPGDLVIILSKSGSAEESVYLVNLLKEREGVTLWLISFEDRSALADMMENRIIVTLEHEGDQWNIIPNNSTAVNLIILQELVIELSRRLSLKLEEDFKPNHPGGVIGARLRNE